ncbi:hypothetical protein RHMOL_Rhmol10G0233400 [Rhododendron molle]|uniref:Uncharacterized protein n=1 Tax=Rhododendron molle TaxID=49168 RepID=A0ACC0M591_RHOML|nr:hypothetical protein RHMOL_Rhmol10G0233400 [Rhododendron molle]
MDAFKDGFLGPGYSDRLLHVGVLFSDLVASCDLSREGFSSLQIVAGPSSFELFDESRIMFCINDSDSLESDEEEDAPIGIMGNGKIKPEVKGAKPAASKGKTGKPESLAKAKVVVEPKKKDESDEDDMNQRMRFYLDFSLFLDMLNASDDIGDSHDSDDEMKMRRLLISTNSVIFVISAAATITTLLPRTYRRRLLQKLLEAKAQDPS